MSTVYDLPASPQRLAAPQTVDTISLHELRVLSDNLVDATDRLPVPLRVIAPTDLDPCAECPDGGHIEAAVAEVCYTASRWAYRVPTCEAHVRPVVRWHLRYGATNVRVEIPAPPAHLIDAHLIDTGATA